MSVGDPCLERCEHGRVVFGGFVLFLNWQNFMGDPLECPRRSGHCCILKSGYHPRLLHRLLIKLRR
jgi:hypothetical protein